MLIFAIPVLEYESEYLQYRTYTCTYSSTGTRTRVRTHVYRYVVLRCVYFLKINTTMDNMCTTCVPVWPYTCKRLLAWHGMDCRFTSIQHVSTLPWYRGIGWPAILPWPGSFSKLQGTSLWIRTGTIAFHEFAPDRTNSDGRPAIAWHTSSLALLYR